MKSDALLTRTGVIIKPLVHDLAILPFGHRNLLHTLSLKILNAPHFLFRACMPSLALKCHPSKSELAHATVGYQLGANDERRLGSGQIKYSARDLVGRTEALERDLGLDTRRDF